MDVDYIFIETGKISLLSIHAHHWVIYAWSMPHTGDHYLNFTMGDILPTYSIFNFLEKVMSELLFRCTTDFKNINSPQEMLKKKKDSNIIVTIKCSAHNQHWSQTYFPYVINSYAPTLEICDLIIYSHIKCSWIIVLVAT